MHTLLRMLVLGGLCSVAHAGEIYAVRCEPGEWPGSRVGFATSGTQVVDSNGIHYGRYVIVYEAGGETAQITYNGQTYPGRIIYEYAGGSDGYVLIVTQPKQIVEQLVVNPATGSVIITYTRQFFGLWQDTFAKRCDVIVGPN